MRELKLRSVENKRRCILDPKMSQMGFGTLKGRPLLKGKYQPEKQAEEYWAGHWQNLTPPKGKGSLFQGICSFQ